jgi:hypothetical protein
LVTISSAHFLSISIQEIDKFTTKNMETTCGLTNSIINLQKNVNKK